MPIPIVVPLIASAVASMASAGKSMVDSNRLNRASRQQNSFNAAEAVKDRLWQEKMFDKQVVLDNTAYQRQVSDMQAAGLNPALLYGSGAGSGASTPAAGSGAQASASYAPPQSLSDLMALPKLLSDIRVQQAQIDNIEADTALKNSQTKGNQIDNIYKPAYWTEYLNQLRAGTDKLKSESALATQKLKTEEYETALRAKGVDIAECELSIKTNEAIMSSIDASAHERLVQLTIQAAELANDEKSAEIDKINAEIGLIYQQGLTEAAKRGLFSAEEKEALARYGVIESTKEFTIATAKAEAHSAEVSAKWAKANQWINAGSKLVGAVASGVGAAGVANAAFGLFGKTVAKIGYGR